MGPGCDSQKCTKGCKDVSNEVRKQIFEDYYGEGADEDTQVRIDDTNYML